jgi:hypothetical protein
MRCVSVQEMVAALGETLIGRRGIELGEFGLEVLVDQEQRPYRASQIAAAACDDLIDRGVV